MRTLSFDTSAGVLHLCLLEDRDPLFELTLEPAGSERQQVASLLMQEIDRAFRELKWDKRSLSLIVAGIGPGSFTGIRVAVITARTLADTLRLPLIGVPLLETYYYQSSIGTPAAIVLSTTSRQFFYGAYERTADDPARALLPPGYGSAEELHCRLSDLPVLADAQALAAFPSAKPLPFLKNIAASQASLAYDRLSLKELLPDSNDGKHELAETFPWRSVLPLYLRNPSVTLKPENAVASPHNDQ